ncbi:MAG: hypothetical protein H7Y27_13590, partial [Gemmatimonadaceae bacterium]|nr:hypothetical protein [Chitinophagaceae bacterium]
EVNKYIEEVTDKVMEYRDKPAILSWNLGNETFNLLAENFSEPYLTKVRQAYVSMIENITIKIKSIDKQHPIFTGLYYTDELASNLHLYRDLCPSIDYIGINTYHISQLRKTDSIFKIADSDRKYFVSEFGGTGDEDSAYQHFNSDKMILEWDDNKKSLNFQDQWNTITSASNRCNGGIAFCWYDRFAGTATLSGITDFRGRKKPAYYALQKSFTGNQPEYSAAAFIVGPIFDLKPNMPYEFTARINDPSFSKLEWRLYSEDFKKEYPLILSSGAKRIWLKVPAKNERFYLYVFAGDNKGNVITASKPIVSYKGVYNDDL